MARFESERAELDRKEDLARLAMFDLPECATKRNLQRDIDLIQEKRGALFDDECETVFGRYNINSE